MAALGLSIIEPKRSATRSAGLVFEPDQFRRFASVAEAFYYNATENPEAVAYDQAQRDSLDQDGRRRYVATSNAQSKQRVLKIACFLESVGVLPGTAVAVLSLQRPEWTEAEMAIYTVGAHLVPAYVRDIEERLGHILRDARVSYAFVENQQQLNQMRSLVEQSNGVRIRHLVAIEEVVDAPRQDPPVTSLREILDQKSPTRPEDSFAFLRTAPDDLACIFYTSGSNGQPKGVPVTHRQVLENLYQISTVEVVEYARFEKSPGMQPIVTLILPEQAHAYPARCAQLVATSPARARYPAVVDRTNSEITPAFRDSVQRDLREAGAGVVLVVPKIAIAIQQRVRQRLAAGGVRERLAKRVIENATAKILRQARGRWHLLADARYALLTPLRRPIVRRIRRQVVGPDFDYFICGGAKLPLETAALLWAIGLPIYEGYGSTETNCPIASNTPHRQHLGSVGKLFPGIEAKVEPSTGELLVRGLNVASGYFGSPDETAAAWDDAGWYHTRDIGHLDEDGFLYIDERLDSMLVLWNGENVSPVAIENRFAVIPAVETAIVIGHNRPALVALVALDEAAMRQWAANHDYVLGADWRRDPAVMVWLRHEVEEEVNRYAGHAYECIRQVAVIEPPTTDRQTLTATEKIRRKDIETTYAELIEELYAAPSSWLNPAGTHEADLRRVAAL